MTVVQLVELRAGLLRGPGEHLVEVLPRPDQAVRRVAARSGHGISSRMPPPRIRKPVVGDPAVLGGGVDPHRDELLDRARGQAVAADLLAGELRLLADDDVEAGLRQPVRRGGAARAGADDDDVCVVLGASRAVMLSVLVKAFTCGRRSILSRSGEAGCSADGQR